MSQSSLFIFHKDWRFRQILLAIVIPQERLVREKKAQTLPEKYGIDNIESSQRLSSIRINNGRVLFDDVSKLKALSRAFEFFIIIIIFLSCIMLCIQTPLDDPNTTFSKTLLVFEVIFTVLF